MKAHFFALLLLASATPCVAAEPNDDCLSISQGPLSVRIDPSIGGRVASFTHQGKEILRTDRDANHWQWGSTVWTSPQADWNWPPIAAFDQEAYEVTAQDGQLIEVTSPIDPTTQLQLIKRFQFARDTKSGPSLQLNYRLANKSNEVRKVALWENTRVNWDGWVEFPSDGEFRLADPQRPVITQPKKNGVVRIKLDSEQPQGQKIFYTPPADLKTLRNRYHSNGLVLTKIRELPVSVAPDQAPLEIYLAPQEGFAELEYQGGFVELKPGEIATLNVIWKLAPRENASIGN